MAKAKYKLILLAPVWRPEQLKRSICYSTKNMDKIVILKDLSRFIKII